MSGNELETKLGMSLDDLIKLQRGQGKSNTRDGTTGRGVRALREKGNKRRGGARMRRTDDAMDVEEDKDKEQRSRPRLDKSVPKGRGGISKVLDTKKNKKTVQLPKGNANAQWKHDGFDALGDDRQRPRLMAGGARTKPKADVLRKVELSNLPGNMTIAEISDLFGLVEGASNVNIRPVGSTTKATAEFPTEELAERCAEFFSQQALDGQPIQARRVGVSGGGIVRLSGGRVMSKVGVNPPPTQQGGRQGGSGGPRRPRGRGRGMRSDMMDED